MSDDRTSQAVLDQGQIEMLRGISPDGSLLKKVVDAFLVEAPGDLADLVEAVKCGDDVGVRQRAHRLGGAAVNLGANSVATLCTQLEELGLDQRLEGAPELLDCLRIELDRAAVAMRCAVAPSPL